MRTRSQIHGATIAYAIVAGLWLLPPTSLLSELLSHPLGVSLGTSLAAYRELAFVIATTALLPLTLGGGQGRRWLAPPFRRLPAALLAAALAAGIVAIIAIAYHATSDRLLADGRQYLSSIADVQGRTLQRHRQLLAAATGAIAGSASLTRSIAQLDSAGDPSGAEALGRQLAATAGAFDFAALQLFDRQGRRIAGSDQSPPPPGLALLAEKATTSGKPQFVRLWDAGGDTRYGFLTPVTDPSDPNRPAEYVLLGESSATSFLYPLLADASRGLRTADIILLRDAGAGRSLIASPQRGGGSPAGTPPLRESVPSDAYAFAATPNGPEPGIGIDHHGRVVLAVRKELAEPGVSLIAKIDLSEILGSAQVIAALTAATAALALLLAFTVGVAANEASKRRAAHRILVQASALNQAEARFRETFEQAAVGIAHVGTDDALLRVNETLCALLGYSKAELEGMAYAAIRAPEDAALDAARQQDLIAGHIHVAHSERRHVRKNGSSIWLARTTTFSRSGEDGRGYFICVLQDISARRAQEEALRESQERFELAVNSTEEGVWDWRRDTAQLYLSPRCFKLLGLPTDSDLDLARFWAERLHPQDRAAFRTAWNRLKTGDSALMEAGLRLRHGDGTYHDFKLRGCARRSSDGRIARLVGMLADVTERKRAESHLRLAAAVFVGANEGLVVTDLAGSIFAINPAFSRITGYGEADVIGHNMNVMRSGRHDGAFYRQMWREVAAKGTWQGEIWNRRKNGEVFLQQLIISTVFDAAGVPQSYLGAFHDITAIKRSEFELDHLAHYDALTDLPNRTLLASLLDHAVSRPGARCAVLCVDLDRFKTVNESYGHVAGDQVLQTSAERMRAALAPNGTLGRYGADEFLVILDELKGPEEAAAAATALIDSLAAPYTFAGGQEVYVGASVGISLYPDDADSAPRLVQHANSALFEAKDRGRGAYSFYTKALTQAAKARIETEAELRRALARGEFELHYQPCVDLVSGRIRSVEALVRWRSPTRGLVPPAQFIPLAEETGIIIPLGDWVLEEACRQMAAWRAKDMVCDYVGVNLSPRQFSRETLRQRVEDVLQRTGLPASALEVEITESMLFEARAAAEQKCQALSQMGVRIALDDFGTGYSSLGYLKRFPISKLKIDRSFVRDLPRAAADGEITVAIIAVAKALGLEVVAEGIETKAQYDFLREKTCGLGQGFLFSRPLPPAELEARFGNARVPLD